MGAKDYSTFSLAQLLEEATRLIELNRDQRQARLDGIAERAAIIASTKIAIAASGQAIDEFRRKLREHRR